jgi:hypothetical protein
MYMPLSMGGTRSTFYLHHVVSIIQIAPTQTLLLAERVIPYIHINIASE